MDDLKKENEYLREQFYGMRVQRRQSIIQDLIRIGTPADAAIADAEKLCSFIEGRAPTAVVTKVKTKKRGRGMVSEMELYASNMYRPKPKPKRKYTKRSKFWKKKG